MPHHSHDFSAGYLNQAPYLWSLTSTAQVSSLLFLAPPALLTWLNNAHLQFLDSSGDLENYCQLLSKECMCFQLEARKWYRKKQDRKMFQVSYLLIFRSSRVQWGSRSCPLSRIKLSLVVMSRSLQFVSGVFTVCRKSTPSLGQMENREDIKACVCTSQQ